MQLVGLGDSAQAYLTAFATELENYLDDVPTDVYVAAGEIPWDGPSLILALGGIAQGTPGANVATSWRSASEAISVVTFHVELIRIVSTTGPLGGVIQLPSQYAMDTEGVSALNDAGALTQTAIILKNKGVGVVLGVDYAIGQCVPIGPMGGLAAMSLELALSIDGSAPPVAYPGH